VNTLIDDYEWEVGQEGNGLQTFEVTFLEIAWEGASSVWIFRFGRVTNQVPFVYNSGEHCHYTSVLNPPPPPNLTYFFG
jgi:hypothetical protein